MNKKLSKSTLDLQQNGSAESTVGRRELNQKIAKLEQADKQNTNTIKQLRAVNEAMRMELRLLRPKNAVLKALDSYCSVNFGNAGSFFLNSK